MPNKVPLRPRPDPRLNGSAVRVSELAAMVASPSAVAVEHHGRLTRYRALALASFPECYSGGLGDSAAGKRRVDSRCKCMGCNRGMPTHGRDRAHELGSFESGTAEDERIDALQHGNTRPPLRRGCQPLAEPSTLPRADSTSKTASSAVGRSSGVQEEGPISSQSKSPEVPGRAQRRVAVVAPHPSRITSASIVIVTSSPTTTPP